MLIDVVDGTDKAVGQIQRDQVFQEHAGFRVAHVFVFNSCGELLIQRLSLQRKRNPGAWGSSVAAYLFACEEYLDAARRRVRQELGISNFTLTSLGKTNMNDEGCLKFITLFSCLYEGPFSYDRSHIDKIEFVAPAEVAEMIASYARAFTPTFVRLFDFYRSLNPLK